MLLFNFIRLNFNGTIKLANYLRPDARAHLHSGVVVGVVEGRGRVVVLAPQQQPDAPRLERADPPHVTQARLFGGEHRHQLTVPVDGGEHVVEDHAFEKLIN